MFREANADFVLCIDCHVMFAPGALRQVLDYFLAHPDTPDLLQGPLLYDDLDVLFTADAIPRLETALQELRGHSWQLLYPGACRWNRESPKADGATHLAPAGPVTCAHDLAYHASIYDRILGDVPRGEAEMEEWLNTLRGIDRYYALSMTSGKYLLSPVIATQASILGMESDEVRRQILVTKPGGKAVNCVRRRAARRLENMRLFDNYLAGRNGTNPQARRGRAKNGNCNMLL